MDMTGTPVPIHLRTDAKNLVTTATTTHLPEQAETVHMITQLRQEALSGSIHDLAHVVTGDCMSDCLTKSTAKADNLINAIDTGLLPNSDKHPSFRELMATRHKAYITASATLINWISKYLPSSRRIDTSQGTMRLGKVYTYLGIPVAQA